MSEALYTVRKLRRPFFCIAYFFLSSFTLWTLAPVLSGTQEPWDAPYPLYSGWLIASGLIGGALMKPEDIRFILWIVWLPCALGQWVRAGDDVWWQLALITTTLGSLFAVVAFLIGIPLGAAIRTAYRKWHARPPS